jgi:hypothetical protein
LKVELTDEAKQQAREEIGYWGPSFSTFRASRSASVKNAFVVAVLSPPSEDHAQTLKVTPSAKFGVLARLSRAPKRSVGG